MKLLFYVLLSILLLQSCIQKEVSNQNQNKEENQTKQVRKDSDFVLAFGSCASQDSQNPFWKEILENDINVWIWGGDLVYGEISNMKDFASAYQKQKQKADYQDFIKKTKVIGIWDDHDYGLNDAGAENPKKKEAQGLFLDFFDVPQDDPRRQKEGVYFTETFEVKKDKKIKVILLDTRYFRTSLTPDTESEKRYKPNKYGEGTMLGEEQWSWLEQELNNSKADFNVIVSSIQFLAYEHGYETWANMPHQADKLKHLIRDSGAKGTIILSGDRHISEISKTEIEGLSYSLYDFTSSGLTHSYDSSTEKNPFRVSKLITAKSYGLLKFDFESNTVLMELKGEKQLLLDSLKIHY